MINKYKYYLFATNKFSSYSNDYSCTLLWKCLPMSACLAHLAWMPQSPLCQQLCVRHIRMRCKHENHWIKCTTGKV